MTVARDAGGARDPYDLERFVRAQEGDYDRALLEIAARLQDVGYVINYDQHHKHSYHLIRNSRLPGIRAHDLELIANVARYHRGAHPKLEHKGFAALDAQDREVVEKLGAILRLADGLDRTHVDAVRGLEVWLDGDRLIVLVDCPFGCEAEVLAGEKKGRWFGELFGLQVEVRSRFESV